MHLFAPAAAPQQASIAGPLEYEIYNLPKAKRNFENSVLKNKNETMERSFIIVENSAS